MPWDEGAFLTVTILISKLKSWEWARPVSRLVCATTKHSWFAWTPKLVDVHWTDTCTTTQNAVSNCYTDTTSSLMQREGRMLIWSFFSVLYRKFEESCPNGQRCFGDIGLQCNNNTGTCVCSGNTFYNGSACGKLCWSFTRCSISNEHSWGFFQLNDSEWEVHARATRVVTLIKASNVSWTSVLVQTRTDTGTTIPFHAVTHIRCRNLFWSFFS